MDADELKKKIEKLPKWAQSHIIFLERQISALSGQIEVANGKHPESLIFVDGHSFSKDIHLPTTSSVSFCAGKGREERHKIISVRIDEHKNKACIIVRTNGDALLMRPCSTNKILLWTERI